MKVGTHRAPGEVSRNRTAGFVRALAPGWHWACRLCTTASHPDNPWLTRAEANARLAAHQLADHQTWVLGALAARAARKEAA